MQRQTRRGAVRSDGSEVSVACGSGRTLPAASEIRTPAVGSWMKTIGMSWPRTGGLQLPSLLLLLFSAGMGQVEGLGETPFAARIGFLMPLPAPDDAIPNRLADEWISAARVATVVQNDKYRMSFTIEPLFESTRCSETVAKDAAQRLVDKGVLGVVGPACSEAVLGANQVLGPAGIPFVSFAATADQFQDRSFYPTFFRTVFGDRAQSAAVQAVIEYFQFKRVTVFYTDETYGQALGYDIIKRSNDAGLGVRSIRVPFPVARDFDYTQLFFTADDNGGAKPLDADDQGIVVFAVLPTIAEGLWRAANTLGLLSYPWWYLATDGAIAFDLVGEGDNLGNLTTAMQGEIGISPWKGDYSDGSPLLEYLDYWKLQPHDILPGLATLDVQPPIPFTRAYVPYLFDAVQAFYEAVYYIIDKMGVEPTTAFVLSCFQGELPNCIDFEGATGRVSFNKSNGERSSTHAVVAYNLVNLDGVTWQPKATWNARDRVRFATAIRTVTRPGPIPADAPTAGKAVDAPKYTAPSSYEAAQVVSPDFLDDFAFPPDAGFPVDLDDETDLPTEDYDGSEGLSTREKWLIAIVVVLGVLVGGLAVFLGVVIYKNRQMYQRMKGQDVDLDDAIPISTPHNPDSASRYWVEKAEA